MENREDAILFDLGAIVGRSSRTSSAHQDFGSTIHCQGTTLILGDSSFRLKLNAFFVLLEPFQIPS